MEAEPRLLVWAEPGQEPLVRDALTVAGATLAGVGSGDTASAATLAQGLETEPLADLRQALQRDDFDLVWLACPQPIHPDERKLIRDLGLRAISAEPRPGTIDALLSRPGEADTAEFVPLLRRSPGFDAASQVLEAFGEMRCVTVAMRSGPGQGTLFARLFDAMDLAFALCGEAVQMDAALASPSAATPEDLSELKGHMTVNLRFSENRCASVAVSDRAGRWFRGLTILGDNGCLRIHDHGFEWLDAEGEVVDSHAEPAQPSPGEMIGAEIARRLESREAPAAPIDPVRLLALCEAARVSCRTGETERPGRMLEMLSRV